MGYTNIHGFIYCLDALNGDIIWQYWLLSPTYTSPAIASGRLYLASHDYFYAFDDSAVYDNPPIVTITGPNYGITMMEYNYTILGEDPEGHDLLVIFEWSREWPGGYYAWERPSGLSEVVTLPFEEEGGYWLRVKAHDNTCYTWSNWTIFFINISQVELKKMFIIGSIKDTNKEDKYTFLTAKNLLTFRFLPFDFQVLSSSESIVVISGDYTGFIGSHFVIGRFNADIIPH
jgi:hypothetical protein